MDNGYEYETVKICPKSGKPFVAPKAWNSKWPRPIYPTCTCCKR